MSVAALDPSNTERWFYDYSVGGYQHTLLMRTAAASNAIDASEAINTFLVNLNTYLAVITSVGLRVALVGSNVTNPQPLTSIEGTYGTGAQGAIYSPVQTTWTGRDNTGHKGRVGMFGAANLNDSSYRITSAESGDIADAVEALGTLSASGFFVSIAGHRLFFHPYANVGINDHFVKQRRGGA